MNAHPSIDSFDHNLPVLSVTQLSLALKRHVEQAFDRVRVRGEISGLKRAGSGHVYFTLKDAEATLDSICWRTMAQRMAVQAEDGLDVIVTGRLTTFPGRSKYQIIVDAIEPAGQGALLKLLEERRQRLAGEGLFDAERKRPLPFLPDVIGVITSPSGAVIRDILHRIVERCPRRILVWPVPVQGQTAAERIAAAIDGFNRLPDGGDTPCPDLLIVARGGGSLEDLWALNEEIVVRAAAASRIPLISAVGHETDTTLIDFAADLRAPTPTAAAEKAVPVRADLQAQVMEDGARLVRAMRRMGEERRSRLTALARGLPRPGRLLDSAKQRLDVWEERLRNGLAADIDRRRRRVSETAARLLHPRHLIDRHNHRVTAETRALATAIGVVLRDRRNRLQHAASLLVSYSYQRVLERGFALVRDRSGHAVTTVAALHPGMGLLLRLHDGERKISVDNGNSDSARSGRGGSRLPTDQGTLL